MYKTRGNRLLVIWLNFLAQHCWYCNGTPHQKYLAGYKRPKISIVYTKKLAGKFYSSHVAMTTISLKMAAKI